MEMQVSFGATLYSIGGKAVQVGCRVGVEVAVGVNVTVAVVVGVSVSVVLAMGTSPLFMLRNTANTVPAPMAKNRITNPIRRGRLMCTSGMRWP